MEHSRPTFIFLFLFFIFYLFPPEKKLQVNPSRAPGTASQESEAILKLWAEIALKKMKASRVKAEVTCVAVSEAVPAGAETDAVETDFASE